MKLEIACGLIAVALAFGAGWRANGVWHDAQERERDRQAYDARLEAQRLAARVTTQNDQRVIAAQSAAMPKLTALRQSVASLRDAYIGLSNESASLLSSARESHAACVDAAAAQKSVLDQCGERYTSLAADAQGHVIDIETLTAAWPRCNVQQ